MEWGRGPLRACTALKTGGLRSVDGRQRLRERHRQVTQIDKSFLWAIDSANGGKLARGDAPSMADAIARAQAALGSAVTEELAKLKPYPCPYCGQMMEPHTD